MRIHRFTEHAERLRMALMGGARSFMILVVDELNKNGGQLTYLEEYSALDGSRQAVSRYAGAPRGVEFLKPGFRPDTLRGEAEKHLKSASRGTADEAREWLNSNSSDQAALVACHSDLERGLKALRQAEEQVEAAAGFLQRPNLDLIGDWGRRRNLPEFLCASTGQGVRLRGPSKEGKRMEVLLQPDLDRLRLPSMPEANGSCAAS
jgi:hypothetical protein